MALSSGSRCLRVFRAEATDKIVTHKPFTLEIATRSGTGAAGGSSSSSSGGAATKLYTIPTKVSERKIKRRENHCSAVSRVWLEAGSGGSGTDHSTGNQQSLSLCAAADNRTSTESGAFLMYVETKGGLTTGRQKQRYVLLKRNALYTLSAPAGMLNAPTEIVSVTLRTYGGDTMALTHWHPSQPVPPVSAHPPEVIPATAAAASAAAAAMAKAKANAAAAAAAAAAAGSGAKPKVVSLKVNLPNNDSKTVTAAAAAAAVRIPGYGSGASVYGSAGSMPSWYAAHTNKPIVNSAAATAATAASSASSTGAGKSVLFKPLHPQSQQSHASLMASAVAAAAACSSPVSAYNALSAYGPIPSLYDSAAFPLAPNYGANGVLSSYPLPNGMPPLPPLPVAGSSSSLASNAFLTLNASETSELAFAAGGSSSFMESSASMSALSGLNTDLLSNSALTNSSFGGLIVRGGNGSGSAMDDDPEFRFPLPAPAPVHAAPVVAAVPSSDDCFDFDDDTTSVATAATYSSAASGSSTAQQPATPDWFAPELKDDWSSALAPSSLPTPSPPPPTPASVPAAASSLSVTVPTPSSTPAAAVSVFSNLIPQRAVATPTAAVPPPIIIPVVASAPVRVPQPTIRIMPTGSSAGMGMRGIVLESKSRASPPRRSRASSRSISPVGNRMTNDERDRDHHLRSGYDSASNDDNEDDSPSTSPSLSPESPSSPVFGESPPRRTAFKTSKDKEPAYPQQHAHAHGGSSGSSSATIRSVGASPVKMPSSLQLQFAHPQPPSQSAYTGPSPLSAASAHTRLLASAAGEYTYERSGFGAAATVATTGKNTRVITATTNGMINSSAAAAAAAATKSSAFVITPASPVPRVAVATAPASPYFIPRY